MPTKKAKRIPLAVYVASHEKERIELFFSRHPELKKGETVKQWILKAIEAQESIEANKTQVDIGVL